MNLPGKWREKLPDAVPEPSNAMILPLCRVFDVRTRGSWGDRDISKMALHDRRGSSMREHMRHPWFLIILCHKQSACSLLMIHSDPFYILIQLRQGEHTGPFRSL